MTTRLLGLWRHHVTHEDCKLTATTSTLRLILVRHAESTNNALFLKLRDEALFSTRADPLLNLEELFEAHREVHPGLSERGKVQAGLLGLHFRSYLSDCHSRPCGLSGSPSLHSSSSTASSSSSSFSSSSASSASLSVASEASVPPESLDGHGEACWQEAGQAWDPLSSRRTANGTGFSAPRPSAEESNGVKEGETGEAGGRDPVDGVRVMVSPLLRTILTALPVLDNLNLKQKDCVLDPELYEVGGLYKVCRQGNRPPVCIAYRGCTKREYEEKFPGRLCAPESIEQGWYNQERGKEGPTEARARAHRVAEKFWRLAERAEAENLKAVVVFSHAHFLDLLMKALCPADEGEEGSAVAFASPPCTRGASAAKSPRGEAAKVQTNFLLHNTGVTCVRLVASLHASRSPEPGSLLKAQRRLATACSSPAKKSRIVVVEWLNRLDHLDSLPPQ
ncbi:UNVERIFIED_CONTAM: phosphoglycerate mutase family protein [Hammondia hammondi]|eukprot:XP_008886279.1 phosphoglycerate mutase family protein [Hammondia hammondi]